MKAYINKAISILGSISMVLSMAACQSAEETASQEIVLLDPVGVEETYEMPQYRNIYDFTVHASFVVPYIEEYSFEEGQSFQKYASFPGEYVSRGDDLLLGDVTNIEEQIKNLKESMEQQKESFEESISDLKDNLAKPKSEMELYGDLLEKYLDKVPAEDSAEYATWLAEKNQLQRDYTIKLQKVLELEASIKQKTELYNLDAAYNKTKLKYMEQNRDGAVVSSNMDGYLVALQMYDRGNWINRGTVVAGVGDMNVKLMRCEYLSASKIKKAQEYYAYIGGKKYAVEYQEMNAEEYKQLSANGEKVYSTFTFVEDAPEIAVGSFGVIVLVNESKNNILTISKSALHKDGYEYFVYVDKGGEAVATPVKTGSKDNLYVEILSGITDQDKIITDIAPLTDENGTVTVAKGSVCYNFKGSGYMYYPTSTNVKTELEYGVAHLVKIEAQNFQQVKKGEVLATITVDADSLELQRQQTTLTRLYERIEGPKADLAKDPNNKNLKRQVELQEKEIAELEKVIKKMKSDFATKTIVSPADGVIVSMANLKEGDLIDRNTTLFQIADESTSYIVVEDEKHILNYGNDVTITYNSWDNKSHSATGTVVTANAMALTNPGLRPDYALIAVSADDLSQMAASTMGMNGWWTRSWYTVTAQVREMKDVLLVPRKAVIENAGQTFVNVKQADGTIVQVSFMAGGSDSINYWALDGVTEGMEICLK